MVHMRALLYVYMCVCQQCNNIKNQLDDKNKITNWVQINLPVITIKFIITKKLIVKIVDGIGMTNFNILISK